MSTWSSPVSVFVRVAVTYRSASLSPPHLRTWTVYRLISTLDPPTPFLIAMPDCEARRPLSGICHVGDQSLKGREIA